MFLAQLGKENSIDAAQNAMVETIENAGKTAPTKEEVERAKNGLLKNIELSLNDPNAVGLEMSEYIALGDWRLFFLYRDRLQKVTPEDVKRVADTYFKQSNRTVAQFVPTQKPDRAEIPTLKDGDILAMVKDYKGGEMVAQGEVFDPTPANVQSRIERMDIGEFKVALLPKENRGNSVAVRMSLNFGDEKSLMNRAPAGNFAGQMLMRGTSKHTRQQLQDELDRLKAQVRIFGGATGAAVLIETNRENLPEVMNLVAEMLKDSVFPPDEFELLKQQQLTNLENQRSEPQAIASQTIGQIFNVYPKGHPLYQGTLDEQIAMSKPLLWTT